MIKHLLTVVLAVLFLTTNAQNLPLEFNYSTDGHRLIVGNTVSTGFYDEAEIDTIFIQFSQSNYWSQLAANYEDKIELLASVTHNGVTYDSVGVRFKGQTSYQRLGNADKKSFAITMDAFIDDQNIEGYEGLNLNNAFEDESHMREILYLNAIRKHIPAAKCNFIHLYINGQNWGIYPNVQNLNKEHVDEWFLDNDATRWRAEATVTSGGPGNRFNAGKSTLNYLGDDTTTYIPNYTLKNADKENPWEDLVLACSLIEKTTSSAQIDALLDKFDLDQALWFLASEIIFTDDDGYVYKGGMDYYVYYDLATERIVPIEYDGNSCMALNKISWSPFYKETDTRFPLMNVLMKVPEIRQRYLAHFRTMMETSFDTTYLMNRLDYYSNLMSARYANDPKALYTAQEHQNEIANLKTFIRSRDASIRSNSEFSQTAVVISDVYHEVNSSKWADPSNADSVLVLATSATPASTKEMNLYYGTGLAGRFQSMSMYDDGNHGDGAASDGVYGAYIPAQRGGEQVRYYVESVSNNASESRSYYPAGAEHDVFIYQVTAGGKVASDVVINEVMSSNRFGYADPATGEYDDWVELYNNGSSAVDLSGYFLTDNSTELLKYEFPSGTTIGAGEYLLVWCDNDLTQTGYHADFKLSADGEQVMLLTPNGSIADEVTFGAYTTNFTYSRVPNGTGNFTWQHFTPLMNNETPLGEEELANTTPELMVFPNPSIDNVNILISDKYNGEELVVRSITGRIVHQEVVTVPEFLIDVSLWNSGVYLIQIGEQKKKLVVRH